jgi:hypothetical protein
MTAHFRTHGTGADDGGVRDYTFGVTLSPLTSVEAYQGGLHHNEAEIHIRFGCAKLELGRPAAIDLQRRLLTALATPGINGAATELGGGM